MKIAITTWHEGPNAGTFFQCYGLYYYLKSRNHDVTVIDYIHQSDDMLSRGFMYYFTQLIPLIKNKINRNKKRKEEAILTKQFADKIRKRDERVSKYWQMIPLTNRITTQADFDKLNDKFDAFIVGSDQVWNATMLNRRYFLDYVKPGKIKAAFGPSVGVGSVLPTQRKAYKTYVKDFNLVAVREKLLCDILNEELPHIKAKHLLDPSMLIPREEYLKMAKLPEGIEAGSYLLCYFAPNTKHQEEVVRKYAKEKNLRIVVMAMFGYSWTMKNDIIICPDPSEFLGLISNAAAVFTSSFHCTIFSILFHRNLFVFERKQLSKSADINQRYTEQLSTYGITHRYIPWGQSLNDEILKPIDYNHVENIFQLRLSESKKFLNQLF
ncbi:polysaccharide pyruvyl transferase family protein [Phocaeicola vulgatus]|nr:polysaccharide pyruvyl transferase family protein [Phocaeicola vulgatus]